MYRATPVRRDQADLQLVRPKYAIPVHGEYRHLTAQAKLAENLGIPKTIFFIMKSGDVLELSEEKACVAGHVQTAPFWWTDWA